MVLHLSDAGPPPAVLSAISSTPVSSMKASTNMESFGVYWSRGKGSHHRNPPYSPVTWLALPPGVGGDCLRWHIHHQLYGWSPSSGNWLGPGSSFPRLQELLLPCELCCLFSIEGGYSVPHGSSHGRSSGEWSLQLYTPSCGGLPCPAGHQAHTPIIHSSSEMLKAIHITQVHPWVSSPKSVALLLLATCCPSVSFLPTPLYM